MRDDAVIVAAPVVGPPDLARAWTFEPTVVASLVGAALVYGRGRSRLARRTGGADRRGRAAAFYGGLAVLAFALVSPLDGLASTLFSAHMAQHLVLMLVAAPLLAWARPGAALFGGLPVRARRAAVGVRGERTRPVRDALVNPVVVWTLGTLALWAWHMPTLYDAALRHQAVHAVEHVCFLGTALLFWSVVLHSGGRRRLPRPMAALLVVASSVQGSALGAVLLFAGRPLYSPHLAATTAWGMTPIQDQQLAGGLMWGPPALLYVVVLGWLLVRWFDEMAKEVPSPTPDLVAAVAGELP